jgi:putative Holliday junction resolvase
MKKKYIALDIGDVRIGVARSDSIGMFATPLEVIDRKKIKSIERIKKICLEENTKQIVVGIPKSLNGEEKRQAEKVREYMEKIKRNIDGVEFFEIDERYTTVTADKLLQEMGTKGAIEKRKVVDKIAAAIILQVFLDSKK